jgi:hypothetical protein
VVRPIRQTPATLITIGVHGDRGGKSNILNLTGAAFVKDDHVVCLWFNGWTFGRSKGA